MTRIRFCEHCGGDAPWTSSWCPRCHLHRGEPIRHWFTKVVGVTHRNRDGSSRQAILRRMARAGRGKDAAGRPVHELLGLDHETDNPHDAAATAVVRSNGERLGYLHAELAPDVVAGSAAGCRFACFLMEVTGGTPEAPTHGANLLIVQASPRVTDAEVQRYLDGLDLR